MKKTHLPWSDTKNYAIKILRVSEPMPSGKIEQPHEIAKYWNSAIRRRSWFDENKEALVVLMLNTRYATIGFSLVSLGSMNESIAHPREIFRPAIVAGAYAIIVIHNHPSGDPAPSQADLQVRVRLAECAHLLQIKLLDFVIIGAGKTPYWSARDHDLV